MTTAVIDAPALERQVPTPKPPDPQVHIARFDRSARILHAVIMITFLGLSATGLPLLFSETAWARALAGLFGGFRGAGLMHRVFGATLLAAVAWHGVDVC